MLGAIFFSDSICQSSHGRHHHQFQILSKPISQAGGGGVVSYHINLDFASTAAAAAAATTIATTAQSGGGGNLAGLFDECLRISLSILWKTLLQSI